MRSLLVLYRNPSRSLPGAENVEAREGKTPNGDAKAFFRQRIGVARGLYRSLLMDLHEEAFENVRKWWRAWVEKDVATLEQMLDRDYAELTAMRHFRPMGVDELLEEANQQASRVSITHWEVFDPVTRLFESTVVCSYGFRISGERAGRGFAYMGRATDVLTRKDGRWTYVSHHATLEGSR
jgi:hypothetical protein